MTGNAKRPVEQPAVAATLYVVATPLGNLRDLSLRALDILATADVIGAEDTRVTAVLLRHYGIATRPVSIREHNEARRAAEVVDWLRAGKSVALVSDAGTPAVSDPGARLVAAVHAAGLPVVPVPGPNAAVAALSAAGLEAAHFAFLGFLPTQRKARRDLLARDGCGAIGADHGLGDHARASFVQTLVADGGKGASCRVSSHNRSSSWRAARWR